MGRKPIPDNDLSPAERERLVVENLRLAYRIARDYARRAGVDAEEAAAEGFVGLIRAARKFDRSRDVRFGTFATWCIRSAIVGKIPRMLPTRAVALEHDPATTDRAPEPDAAPEAVVAGLMRRLTGRQREVVCALYGIGTAPETSAAVGKRLGITGPRVRQIRDAAERRMRGFARTEPLAAAWLEDVA